MWNMPRPCSVNQPFFVMTELTKEEPQYKGPLDPLLVAQATAEDVP